MWDKLQNYQDHAAFQKLGQFGTLAQIAFVAIVLLVSYSGLKVIQTNYELQQQMSRMEQEIAVQKLKNDNAKLQNEYLNTPQYLELAARQNYGLALPGEKELLVPKDVALKYAPDTEKAAQPAATNADLPFYEENFQAWLRFFMNRPGTMERAY